MNRNEEYAALLSALEETPLELEQAVERALKREKTFQRKRRAFGIPVGSLAACFTAFVLLVNLFPPFAMACGNVPLLRELVKAVAWSPSLSAAVENEYVQPIEQSQTVNGVTATIHYVIVDQRKLSVFFTLDSKQYDNLTASMPTFDSVGCSYSGAEARPEKGELLSYHIDYIDQTVPDTLTLSFGVSTWSDGAQAPEDLAEDAMLWDSWEEEKPEYLAEFTFTLALDPYFTAQGEVLPVNRTFTLDGQSVTVTEAEVYPTHLRLNFAYDAANTAWLKGLDFYLENEWGERFEAAANGITATGSADTADENMASFWLDSPYFSQGEHLTLHITGAQWLDKDRETVEVDLAAGTGRDFPDGVRVEWTKRRNSGWLVSTSTPYRWGNTAMYSTWSGEYYDADGNKYSTDGHSTQTVPDFPETLSGASLEAHEAYAAANQDRYFETFALKDYAGDTVWLCPNWTRITTQETAVSVVLR